MKINQRHTVITVFTILIISLSACAPVVGAPTQAEPPVPGADEPLPTPTPEQPTPRPGLPVMVDTPESGVPGETPVVPAEVMQLLEADLVERLGSLPPDLRVIRSEAVVWNDGSLGCPQPGVFYTQALVDGYWVVLQSGETTYDYRLGNLAAKPVLCEPRLPDSP